MTPVLSSETPQVQPVIEVSDLIYKYSGSETPAIKGLSFSVNRGEIFGLLGPNGAGKTTTLSLISTLLKIQKGKLVLSGVDVSRNSMEARRLIGFVPQELALYPTFSIKENLQFFGRLCGIRGKMLKTRVSECLEAVDLAERINSPVKELSSGMKRRVNIAAAMMHSPRILLLDEPAVGVDTQTRKLIFEELDRLRSTGMTMIYTTHYMEDAEQLCDRIIIIDHGKCIAEGRPKKLIGDRTECTNLEELFLMMTGKDIRE